jgi:AraC family transcriptional regulator
MGEPMTMRQGEHEVLQNLPSMCDDVAARMRDAADCARRGNDGAAYDLIAAAIELLQKSTAVLREQQGGNEGAEADRRAGICLPAWKARLVIDHIEACLAQPLQVEDLARIAGLSTSHFSRAFKLHFGQTAGLYIRNRRMQLARNYMLSTDYSLAEIALLCGMSDQSHFTRNFQRTFGEAPARWRRAHMCVPPSAADRSGRVAPEASMT